MHTWAAEAPFQGGAKSSPRVFLFRFQYSDMKLQAPSLRIYLFSVLIQGFTNEEGDLLLKWQRLEDFSVFFNPITLLIHIKGVISSKFPQSVIAGFIYDTQNLKTKS